jgi:hypothetical protein
MGSQLFAVALAEDLRDRFPARRLKIVLHSGGVTLRLPEVSTLFPSWDYEFVSDFKSDVSDFMSVNVFSFLNLKHFFRSAIRSVALSIGLVSECNNDSQVLKVRPWVLACRGHYSHRMVTPKFYDLLIEALRLSVEEESGKFENSFVVHYRLGDLLTLTDKSPISKESVVSEFEKMFKSNFFNDLVVLSDSPDIAKDFFAGSPSIPLKAPIFNTLQVMLCAISSSYFLGTSSKISFWVAALRAHDYMKCSSLPSSNRNQMESMLGKDCKVINYYD